MVSIRIRDTAFSLHGNPIQAKLALSLKRQFKVLLSNFFVNLKNSTTVCLVVGSVGWSGSNPRFGDGSNP